MKVYVVKCVCDLEYGRTSLEAIFDTEEKAKAYVDEHQRILSVWFDENGIHEYSYEEWEVE